MEELNRVNKTQLATAVGVSKQYIGKLVKEGKLIFDSDGKIDPAKGRKQIEACKERVKPKVTDTGNPEDTESLTYYKTQTEKYKSQIAEIELQKKKNLLLEADQVKKDAYTVGKKLNDSLMSIPERISNILAVETDALKIRELLLTEIRSSLEEVCNDLEGFVKIL